MPKSQPRKKTESEAESMEISDEAPAQFSETADEDMCACTESGGGGDTQTERAKEQTKPVSNSWALSLLMNAPPRWDCFIFRAVSQPPSV